MSQSLPKRSLHQVIIMFRFLVAPGILTVNFNCKYFSYYTRELLECLLGFRLLGKIPAGAIIAPFPVSSERVCKSAGLRSGSLQSAFVAHPVISKFCVKSALMSVR